MYPKEIIQSFGKFETRKETFKKINGTDKIYSLFINEKYPGWKMVNVHKKERERFLKIRKKYLIPTYE